MKHPELRVSAGRLARNIAAVRARVAPSELMLVVKDDAYGHGATWASQVAQEAGVAWIGTYDVPTAVHLRAELDDGMRLFAWATSADDEIAAALKNDVDLGVGTAAYLDRVIAAATRLGARARVHLKIDTGLHRNGIAPGDWSQTVSHALQAQARGALSLVGVWSHLAEASDEEDDAAYGLFISAVEIARAHGAQIEHTHLTASAATWERAELRGSLVRVGAFCYGVRSADGPELDGIAPISTLMASVGEVTDSTVSISVGSLDGLPSTLSGRVEVGTPGGARLLTGIGLTSSRVDAWPDARIGDEVFVFGSGTHGERSATSLAETIDSVGEEILTRITSYVARTYTD